MVNVAFQALWIFTLSALGHASYVTNHDLHQKIAELKLRALDQDAQIQHLETDVKPLSNVARRLDTKLLGGSNYTNDPITGTRLRNQPFTIYSDNTTEWEKWNQNTAMDQTWLVLCGAFGMLMQAGFAMREAGFCRFKNVQNSLLRNLGDLCIATAAWWICGYSWAFSGPYFENNYRNSRIFKKDFMGHDQFAGHDFLETVNEQQSPTIQMGFWFFQWTFCATATTIVSGALAERVRFPGYAIFTVVMTGFVYPVVVAWTQGAGWLNELLATGFFDFANSGVVHMAGGTAALVGAVIAGPRRDHFLGKIPKERLLEKDFKFMAHSQPLIIFGTLLLWIGWYGVNCGSTLAMSNFEDGAKAAQVAMNTTIAASVSGIVSYFFRVWLWSNKFDIDGVCNGVLAGLVSISAGCSNVEFGTAAGIGFAAGLIFNFTSVTLRMFCIDDPVDAFAVHGACGAWGVFAAALFDFGSGLDYFNGWSGFRCVLNRNTLGCKGEVDDLSKSIVPANLSEIFSIIAWVGAWAALLFLILKCTGLLVMSDDDDEQGQDVLYHAPTKAYDPYNDFHWEEEEPEIREDYI